MSNLSKQVADTIQSQIGNQALFMIGAKNLAFGGEFGTDQRPYLSFRIGKNSNKINYIKISINENDLYDMEFGYIRGVNYTVRKTLVDIYCDSLNKMIEIETGLYTSL